VTIHPFECLTFLAEVSVTLIGFIAVFLVISNKEGRFDAADRHFVQAMVVAASFSILLAIAPASLSFFVPEGLLWTAATFVGVAIGLPMIILQLRIQFSMGAEEAAKIHWGWHLTAWSMGGLAALLLVLGLVGLADPVIMYVSAASLIAILALWSFIAVVFRRFF